MSAEDTSIADIYKEQIREHRAAGRITDEKMAQLFAQIDRKYGSSSAVSGDGTTHTVVSVAARANQANTDPTPAQASSGVYKHGHLTFHGLNIAIENPKGSVRRGVDAAGTPWERAMAAHYGYVKATTGFDSDPVDVFIGDSPESEMVYVIDQVTPDGLFDEHKVVLGVGMPTDAVALYLAHYPEGWRGLGAMRSMTMGEFKAWLADPLRSQHPVGLPYTTRKDS